MWLMRTVTDQMDILGTIPPAMKLRKINEKRVFNENTDKKNKEKVEKQYRFSTLFSQKKPVRSN